MAIDQEGGEVKRLPSLPPDRSPAEIGRAGEPAAAAEGPATGRALRALGIDVDLAPVLDVPSVDGAFIASRAFSVDPGRAAACAVAFGTALQAEGVAATAKHFPGLGMAVANTDLDPSPVDASRAELEAGLAPFEAAIDAGFELVMVSNATYPAFDPDRPASLSRRIVDGVLRERLGFEGAVITDDLGAGGIAGAGIDEATAAVESARAGADLLLFALTEGDGGRGRARRRDPLGRARSRAAARLLRPDDGAAGTARRLARQPRLDLKAGVVARVHPVARSKPADPHVGVHDHRRDPLVAVGLAQRDRAASAALQVLELLSHSAADRVAVAADDRDGRRGRPRRPSP